MCALEGRGGEAGARGTTGSWGDGPLAPRTGKDKGQIRGTQRPCKGSPWTCWGSTRPPGAHPPPCASHPESQAHGHFRAALPPALHRQVGPTPRHRCHRDRGSPSGAWRGEERRGSPGQPCTLEKPRRAGVVPIFPHAVIREVFINFCAPGHRLSSCLHYQLM